jgi:5-methylcytosine-specific restriction endonuclease McrA
MIPKKSTKPRRPKLSTLQDKADKLMSLYIRQKYAYNGMVKCVSCGKLMPWKESDCGHFVPKSRGAAVRYVEENVHPECQSCNRFDEGHLIDYTRFMIYLYGHEKIDELKSEARKTLSPTQKRKLVEEAIEYYGARLKEME